MFDFIKRRELEARRRGFSKGITIGTIIGGVLGGIAGILTAPDSGENTRKKLQENAALIKDSIEDDLIDMKKKINDEVVQSIEWLRKEISEAKEIFKKEKIKEEKLLDGVIESEAPEKTHKKEEK